MSQSPWTPVSVWEFVVHASAFKRLCESAVWEPGTSRSLILFGFFVTRRGPRETKWIKGGREGRKDGGKGQLEGVRRREEKMAGSIVQSFRILRFHLHFSGRQEVLHVQGVHGHSSKWCKVLGKVGRSAVRPHLDISEDKSLMAIVVDEVVWTTRLV